MSVERENRRERSSTTVGIRMDFFFKALRYRARTPATPGVAMLVPDIWANPPPGRQLQMFTPAKAVSILAPRDVNEAGEKSELSAATEIP